MNVKQPWRGDQPAANKYVDPFLPQAKWRYREHLRAYKNDTRQDSDICCRHVVTEFQGTRRDAQPDREQPAAPIFPLYRQIKTNFGHVSPLSSYEVCRPLHELSGAFAEGLVQRINRSSGIHGFWGRVAFKNTRAKQAAIRRNDFGAEFDLGRGHGRRRQLELSQVEKELIVSRHVFRRPGNREPGIFESLDYFLLHKLGRAVAPFRAG